MPPEYIVTDPVTGKRIKMIGDSPPTEADIDQAFAPSASATFGIEAAETLANNLLGLPGGISKIAGTALAQGAAVLGAGNGTFSERVEQQKARAPASGLLAFPQPTVQDVGALVRSIPSLLPGGRKPSEAFTEESEAFAALSERRKRAHPTAAAVGGVAGDVATIVGGRLPISRGAAKLEAKIAPKAPDAAFGGARTAALDPGSARFADRIVNSKALRKLARGAGRSVETGFEAAVLEIVKGDDPLELAAMAAGGQMAGSMFLTVGEGLLSGGPIKVGNKILLAGAGTAAILQMLKNVAPGGEDNFIANLNDGFDKVTFAVVLGVVSTLAGSGRLRSKKIGEDFPKITDALAATPRAATISILEGWLDASPPERFKIETQLGLTDQ